MRRISDWCLFFAASAPQGVSAPPSVPSHTTAQPRFHVDEPASASPTSADGWGDAQEQAFANDDDEKDGWGDMDLPAEPAPALARIRAAQQKPVASTQQKPVALQKPTSTTTSTTARLVTKPSKLKPLPKTPVPSHLILNIPAEVLLISNITMLRIVSAFSKLLDLTVRDGLQVVRE